MPASRAERSGWVGVLALAAALRLAGIGASLPYIGYVDEGAVIHPAITLLRHGGWDPAYYLYPSLPFYVIVGAAQAARPFYAARHGHPLREDLPAEGGTFTYDLVSPPELVLAARLAYAALSVLTVLFAGLLARRLAGPRVGLLAALLAALCPALVQRGAIVIVDTVAAFFVAAALLLAERVRGAPRARTLAAAAGAAVGLAAVSKYTLAAAVAAPLVAVARRRDGVGEKVRLALLVAAGAAAGAVLGMPALVFKTAAVRDALAEQARLYANPLSFDPHYGGPGYLRQLLLPHEVGVALALAAAAGLTLMLAGRERDTALGWAAFAVLLVAPLAGLAFHPFRNLLSLVPPLAVAAALPFERGFASARWRAAAAVAAALTAGTLAYSDLRYVLPARFASRDSRVAVVDGLAAHARPTDEVCVERELAILPSELARIPAHVRLASWREMPELAGRGRCAWVVGGPVDLFGSRDAALLRDEARWASWMASRTPDLAVGVNPTPIHPNFWRTNAERIGVYRSSSTTTSFDSPAATSTSSVRER